MNLFLPNEREYEYMADRRRVPLTLWRSVWVPGFIALVLFAILSFYLAGYLRGLPGWHPELSNTLWVLLVPAFLVIGVSGAQLLKVSGAFLFCLHHLSRTLRESAGSDIPAELRELSSNPKVVEEARMEKRREERIAV